MTEPKKPKDKPAEIQEAVRESVDFKHKHVDVNLRRRKLESARKWLRAPLQEFLRELQISEDDPEYDELVAIWRSFHE